MEFDQRIWPYTGVENMKTFLPKRNFINKVLLNKFRIDNTSLKPFVKKILKPVL